MLRILHVDWCPFMISRASVPFVQCKKHYTSYIEVVQQVGGFAVREGGDGIGQVSIRTSE
jgi:hypothetical protein